MLVTGWLAGESALHVVLGQRMAADLRRSTPSVRRTLVLNNAGLVERPPSLARRSTDGPFILGHLSNLTRPKGVELVIDAAAGAHRAGHAIELWVAGPCHDRHAREAIDRGRKELGEKFRYLGPLNGDAKYTFYSQLDLFLFPTFYRNEAAPLVLLEALACGTPCVATDVGCISEQLGRDGGTVSTIETFAADVLMWVAQTARERQIGSERATQQFTHLAQEHTSQMSALIELLTSGREPPTGGVRYLSNPSSGPGLLR
jgi:glycosyltransferase involved in cell wall biosynthesis